MAKPKHFDPAALELALEGDTTALRLCLERIAPPRRDAPVIFGLPPMQSTADAANASGAVLVNVAAGNLTPIESVRVILEQVANPTPQKLVHWWNMKKRSKSDWLFR